jgi:hypothetical protein
MDGRIPPAIAWLVPVCMIPALMAGGQWLFGSPLFGGALLAVRFLNHRDDPRQAMRPSDPP